MKIKAFITVFFLLQFPGCLSSPEVTNDNLRLATTTSLRDSGLLDVLLHDFTTASGVEVEYVAVGTGAALLLGEQGDVDALLVHAPEQEEAFIENGFGYNRTLIAWNAFVLLSPIPLPSTIHDAFLEIADNEHCFISRGDDSGTHIKEQAIWSMINETHDLPLVNDSNGLHPSGDWYYSIGQGMGAAINMAHEKECITLSDRGTALRFQDTITLDRYEYNDSIMHNPYSFIFVSQGEANGATTLLDYILGDGRATIESFTINGDAAFFVY
ncbi:MAG: tungsten ABC transporter substrate-binding protein [Euryarchaeota archaeon]|nr:tungsten ABC transporter substrate-binding protein [Euryarchaeota archaeon]